jgi:hypothetical protein
MTTSATVSSKVNWTSATDADGLGPIGDGVDLDGCRDRGLEHRHHIVDALNGFDDVGPRLAVDRQSDRSLVVFPARNQFILSRTDGAADIADAHR